MQGDLRHERPSDMQQPPGYTLSASDGRVQRYASPLDCGSEFLAATEYILAPAVCTTVQGENQAISSHWGQGE